MTKVSIWQVLLILKRLVYVNYLTPKALEEGFPEPSEDDGKRSMHSDGFENGFFLSLASII